MSSLCQSHCHIENVKHGSHCINAHRLVVDLDGGWFIVNQIVQWQTFNAGMLGAPSWNHFLRSGLTQAVLPWDPFNFFLLQLMVHLGPQAQTWQRVWGQNFWRVWTQKFRFYTWNHWGWQLRGKSFCLAAMRIPCRCCIRAWIWNPCIGVLRTLFGLARLPCHP